MPLNWAVGGKYITASILQTWQNSAARNVFVLWESTDSQWTRSIERNSAKPVFFTSLLKIRNIAKDTGESGFYSSCQKLNYKQDQKQGRNLEQLIWYCQWSNWIFFTLFAWKANVVFHSLLRKGKKMQCTYNPNWTTL